MTKKTEEEKEQRSGLIDAVREIPSLYDKSNLDYMTDSKKTSTKWAEVATTAGYTGLFFVPHFHNFIYYTNSHNIRTFFISISIFAQAFLKQLSCVICYSSFLQASLIT
jgi:hypothetical protein